MKNIFLLKVLLTLSSPVCKAFQSSKGIFKACKLVSFRGFGKTSFQKHQKLFLQWVYGITVFSFAILYLK